MLLEDPNNDVFVRVDIIETSELGQFEERIDKAYAKIREATSYPAKKGWFCKSADLLISAKVQRGNMIGSSPTLKLSLKVRKKRKELRP